MAAALRTAAAALTLRHGAALRKAAVAQWEVKLRVPDKSGAWRVVVSAPTGACTLIPPAGCSLSICRAAPSATF